MTKWFMSLCFSLGLVAAGTISANETQQSGDYSYLGKNLSIAPSITVQRGGAPVTNKLAGQKLMLIYSAADTPASKVYMHFRDSQRLDWHPVGHNLRRPLKSDTEPYYEDYYIAFEVARNIYFITFVEQLAEDKEAQRHEQQQLVAFVMDLNKMTFTDSFMENEKGPMQWILGQGKVARIKD